MCGGCMNVLINAITIKEGGGAVVFIKTFNEIIHLENNIRWFVIIDEKLRDQLQTNERVTLLTFPWIKKSTPHFLFFNEVFLHRLIKKFSINCFFSVINTLPFRKLPCKTVLHILHAGYFSKEFITLTFKYSNSFREKIGFTIRKWWVFLSLKKADQIVSPTKALADEIITQLKIDSTKMAVILPGAGLADGEVFPKQHQQKTWRIGYITKYGVQKNFEVLFKAAAELKLQKVDFKLIFTLSTNHVSFYRIKKLIEKYNITDVIENHGESTEEQLRNLYLTLDLFIFPSLCESIGFTLIEAIYYGLPIVAADTNSNRELLGEKGMFFGPHDHRELFDKMLQVIEKENVYLDLSDYSRDRAHVFSWEKTAESTLNLLRASTCITN